MIVRTLAEVAGTEREVSATNWSSRRLLVRGDGMGFSLHDTVIHAGTSTEMQYQNHLEAVYCVEGQGMLRDLTTGREYPIAPGTVYALDKHDRHMLTAVTRLRMVCVFNPPVIGTETHDENGGYPALELEEQRR